MPAAPEKMWPVLCGTDSAIDRWLHALSIGPAKVRHSPVGSSGSPNIDPSFYALVAHLLQQFVDVQRAGVGARRKGRLEDLCGRLNARACLGRPAWLQHV